jgi:hypothetical protein
VTETDPLKAFESLDYPGRRKPVNRTVTAKGQSDTVVWDSHPATYVVAGEKREFFYIGALAKALGYSVQSIRAWESQGLLPNSPYRSPRTARPVAGGRSDKGKRIWTRKQIEGILALAKQHKVILNREPPTKGFATDVAKLFNRLLDEEMKQ